MPAAMVQIVLAPFISVMFAAVVLSATTSTAVTSRFTRSAIRIEYIDWSDAAGGGNYTEGHNRLSAGTNVRGNDDPIRLDSIYFNQYCLVRHHSPDWPAVDGIGHAG